MGHPFCLPFAACTGTFRYFLTICTDGRDRHFVDAATVELTRTQFLRSATAGRFAVIAYCFMPDHVHFIIEGLAVDANLRRFVKDAKQRTGFQFRRTHRARLWQENYFDRTLRVDESLPGVVRYLVNNPIRAGLVTNLADYPHWGSGVYTRAELIEFVQMS